MISVIPAKTKHSSGLEVELPMHPELRAELLKLKHKSPYVLPDTSARYILKARRSWLVVEIQRFLAGQGFQVHKDLEGVKRTAVVQYGYHSLRHTFISTCINAGIPTEVIRAIVGDSYRIYTHVNQASKQRAIDVLPMMSKMRGKKPATQYSKLTDAELKRTLVGARLEMERRKQGA